MNAAILLANKSPSADLFQNFEWQGGSLVPGFPSRSHAPIPNSLPISAIQQLSLREGRGNEWTSPIYPSYPTLVPLFNPLNIASTRFGTLFSTSAIRQNLDATRNALLHNGLQGTSQVKAQQSEEALHNYRSGASRHHILELLQPNPSRLQEGAIKIECSGSADPLRSERSHVRENRVNETSVTQRENKLLLTRKRSSSWPPGPSLSKKKLAEKTANNGIIDAYKNLEIDVAKILVSDIPIPVIGPSFSKENSFQSGSTHDVDVTTAAKESGSESDASSASENDEDVSANVRHKPAEVVFTCQQCLVVFESIEDLILHTSRPNSCNFAFKCNVCTQVFRSVNGLQKHVEFHADHRNSFQCSFCFKTLSDRDSLEEHVIARHMSKRPHKCLYCPKAFRDPGSLQKHVRIHTGEKPYKCTACDKSFAEYSSLRKHYRVHTGEQPYKCQYCPKAFSISGNLQRHILIHTGERPYKCSECSKTFNNPSHLRRHEKNLHSRLEGQK